jgi:peptidyl-prolyl cis-trans isomerase C
MTVNGQPITRDMLQVALAELPPEMREQALSPELLPQLQDKLLYQELLWQEATARGLADDPLIRERLAFAQREVLAYAVMEAEADKRSDDAALRAYYEAHPDYFATQQVHARHILVTEESQILALAERARAGEDFAALARAHSIDPGSGPLGGDLGWFGRGQMVPEFEAVAFSGVIGTVQGPVRSQFGWHLILVEGARDKVPLGEVSERLRQKLRQEAAQSYLEELRQRSQIDIAPGRSP